MRNILQILSLSTLLLLSSLHVAQAQKAPKFAGLDASPLDMAYTPRRGAKEIRVIYSRPAKKGRAIFGNLVKYGKVWRTGANEATIIQFAQDVKLGETTIPAGSYQLFTVPGEETWELIINGESGQWGAYSYQKSSDVARLEVPVQESEEEIEHFSISIKQTDTGATVYMGWDKTYVEVPFSY